MKKIILILTVLTLCVSATGIASAKAIDSASPKLLNTNSAGSAPSSATVNSTQTGSAVPQPTIQNNTNSGTEAGKAIESISGASATNSGPVPMVVPMGSTITVNSTETNPVKVENLPTATSAVSGGAAPTIVSQVNISNEQQKIEINYNKESKETQISIAGGVSVSTTQPVQIESSRLYMETSTGMQEVKISPTEASSMVPEAIEVKGITLQESSQAAVYNISGTKEARIFFLIPVSFSVETQVSAQTGQIVSVQKPWWSIFAW